MTKNTLKRREWSNRITHWRQSGMSARAWCQEHQIVYTTFMGWRTRLKDRSSAPQTKQHSPLTSSSKIQFVELVNEPKSSPGIFLEYDGIQIHLSKDFDVALLRKCLNVLRGDLC